MRNIVELRVKHFSDKLSKLNYLFWVSTHVHMYVEATSPTELDTLKDREKQETTEIHLNISLKKQLHCQPPPPSPIIWSYEKVIRAIQAILGKEVLSLEDIWIR